MQSKDIPKVVGLLAGTLCLIGFVVWNVLRSDRLEQRLFNELDEVAELDNELCPFDGALTQTSRVLLFDFSDPLPAEVADYPDTLLENMLADLQEAERFDRFGMYTLNPNADVPRNVATFCVPVTMSQIPRDVRQALWGADPTQHAALPSRYERFSDVFERLWENDRELRESVEEARSTLLGEARSTEQGFSRIIENVEEIVGLEIDRDARQVNFVILSNMLQNSPTYSHYRNRWDFREYLSRRSAELPSMRRFTFDVYLVQSCQSVTTDRRRALQQFWEDYFEQSDASVQFRLLGIDGSSCGGGSAGSTGSGRPPGTGVQATNGLAPAAAGGATGALPSGDAVATAANGGDSAPISVECPNPEVRGLPSLLYPRNARGTAILRYTIQVDERGVPVELVLYDMDIADAQHEQRFVDAADSYIRRLRFDVHADDNCTGGRTTNFALRYE